MKIKVFTVDKDYIDRLWEYFNEEDIIIVGIKELIKLLKSNNNLQELVDNKILLEITKLLHGLGMPSNIKGYQYIRSAILMVYNNPNLISSITKGLYYHLSSEYNTSCQRIERSIRHAIEISWNRGDIELMDSLFGHSINVEKSKPTNSEFIVTIADKLRIEKIKVN